MEEAKRRNPRTARALFDFIQETSAAQKPGSISALKTGEQVIDFVMKLQQLTGPVMAKAVEDTAFYVYNRLTSLNEVGRRPRTVRAAAGVLSPAERYSSTALAALDAHHLNPRHQAQRGRSRPY